MRDLPAANSFSQGLTCDQVAVSYDQGSFGGIDRRGFYVSVSRGREDVRIFCDDKDFVRDCLRRNTGERQTATELVGTAPASVLTQHLRRQRLQALHAATQVINLAPDILHQRTPAMSSSPMDPDCSRGR